MTGPNGAVDVAGLRLNNDRSVAVARVGIAALSFIAVWAVSARPAVGQAWFVDALFGAYLAVSAGFLLADYLDRMTERARVWLHALDLVFVAMVTYFTHGATRAFFGLFVFVLLAAHLRWRWQGTLWTAITALSIYIAIKAPVAAAEFGRDGIDQFAIGVIYLGIVAGLFVYLSRTQEETIRRMIVAAAWPNSPAADRALPAYLEHACRVLGTAWLCLVWFPEDQATADISSFGPQRGFHADRCERDLIENWFASGAKSRVFFWDRRSNRAAVANDGRLRPVTKPPFPEMLCLPDAPALLVIPFVAGAGYGCLLAPRRVLGADDLILGEIVAARFHAWADGCALIRDLREAEVRQQHFELASELHDGVLQTMVGTSLQLHSLHRLIAATEPRAGRRLDHLAKALTCATSDLRRRLHDLVPTWATAGGNVDLCERLRTLATKLEQDWNLVTTFRLEPPDAEVSAYICHQLDHLLTEAAANAAKHSRATAISIIITVQPEDILISVSNDRLSSPTSATAMFDPRMLRARLEHLKGTLQVQLNPGQVVLEMVFPTPETLVA